VYIREDNYTPAKMVSIVPIVMSNI